MFVGLSHRGSRRVIPQAAAMVWQPYKHNSNNHSGLLKRSPDSSIMAFFNEKRFFSCFCLLKQFFVYFCPVISPSRGR